MAQIEPIVKVDIVLQTSTQTRQGFGTLLFSTADRRFPEVIRTYNSLTEVADDFATTDAAYLAAQSYFSQSPRPTQIKIGQENADVTFTPTAAAALGEIYKFTFIDNLNASTVVTYTSVGADDAATIVTGLKDAMDAAGLTNNGAPEDDKVTASGTTTLILTSANSLGFGIDNVDQSTNLSRTAASDGSEGAADLINKYAANDGDWYFYATDNSTEAFVTATAAAIEPLRKLYFYSTDAAVSLLTVTDPIAAGDIMAQLQSSGYTRSIGLWHNVLTNFPECAYIGVNAPFDAGSVVWANIELAGIAEPRDPVTGLTLNAGQKQEVANRNGNVQVAKGNALVVRLGKVAQGEAISTIRGSDAMNDAISVAICNILLGAKGTRIVFDNTDINEFGAVIGTVLDDFVTRKFILDDYVVTLPKAEDIPASEKATGTLSGIEFQANLAAAILSAEVLGTISI